MQLFLLLNFDVSKRLNKNTKGLTLTTHPTCCNSSTQKIPSVSYQKFIYIILFISFMVRTLFCLVCKDKSLIQNMLEVGGIRMIND